MDYRRTSLVVNGKQQAVANNAHIYSSFAGPGGPRTANGLLVETPTMWWDEERIEASVTRQFVLANLRPDEQLRLDEPMKFGEGLTDDTYIEWIEQKAKRIFLILLDLGVPDQIFGVIDDSWDDEDLPVPFDQVERLRLTYEKDERMDKRFFQRQFVYLLRNLQKGDNLLYEDEEVVPLEMAEKRSVGNMPGLIVSNVDKVHLPGRPDDIFLRRRIPLGNTPGHMAKEEFLAGVESMKAIEHDHLTCLWASYSHQGFGYLLLTPVNDSSLRSFLTVSPQSYKILAKQERRVLMLNWMHCLADALAFLHGKGLSHRNIKPSSIMLDQENHIFLSDCGIFTSSPLTGDKRGFDKETYDHSAPEKAPRPEKAAPIYNANARSTTRSTVARPSTGPSQSPTFPIIGSSVTSSSGSASIRTTSTGSNDNPPCSPTKSSYQTDTTHDPQKSDVFSLGTIFLEITTFLLKRATRNFASHRSAKNKTPGRGGGLPDASFHKNLKQVESWMNTLAKDASKKEDQIFRGVSHILVLVDSMLSVNPDHRPTAQEVQERMYSILSEYSGMGQREGEEGRGRIHCETRNTEQAGWDFGFDELRLASQRAAAAACASVAPISTLVGNISSDTTVIHPGMQLERLATDRSGALSPGIMSPNRVMSPPLQSPGRRDKRDSTKEGDQISINTKTSRSSEGNSRGSSNGGSGKVKAKVKAWQAPVYAEMSWG